MKTYAPKTLHGSMLRELLAELAVTPAQAAKFLRVSERTVWRWLSDQSAPFAILAALWHETPTGRRITACDVGNEARILYGLANANSDARQAAEKQLARILAISDTGAMNEPLFSGPNGQFSGQKYRIDPLFIGRETGNQQAGQESGRDDRNHVFNDQFRGR